jgi:cysteinyl-tRNA synthetase
MTIAMLVLYNTLTRKKEAFQPIEDSKVRMYSCGLTVYDYAHLGNLRAYVFVDLLKRWLEYRGFEVMHVMNITDVDDKTIRGMSEAGLSLKEFTEKFAEAFCEDLRLLNVKSPNITPRATEHVREMVSFVQALIDKGYGYRGEDGSIYYRISRFKKYGELSKMKIAELKPGARVKVDEYSKERASDFALWKAWTPRDGAVYWDTSLGKGRPGWHIECSAMSMKYLGKALDIHTGGVDNIFPHHENEIAQSEGVTGKRFVNYWLHNEHLLIKGERMGKSLRNFRTLRDLLKMGHNALSVRFFLLSTHYRKQLSFTIKGLLAAENALKRLQDLIERLAGIKKTKDASDIGELLRNTRRDFEEAMDDDLDIGKALASVFNLVKRVNILIDNKRLNVAQAGYVRDLLKEFDKVLGVLEEALRRRSATIPAEVKTLIEKREAARSLGDWETADMIRDELQSQGIVLEDTPDGVKWRRKGSQSS